MNLIQVKESHFASELTVLKSRLESEGIHCHIDGELTAQVLPHIACTQAKLMVHEADINRVKEIMEETGEWHAENTQVICPKCGSPDYKSVRSIKEFWILLVSFFVALVTFVPIGNVLKPSKVICKKCETSFEI